jgi:hypothetical protein
MDSDGVLFLSLAAGFAVFIWSIMLLDYLETKACLAALATVPIADAQWYLEAVRACK